MRVIFRISILAVVFVLLITITCFKLFGYRDTLDHGSVLRELKLYKPGRGKALRVQSNNFKECPERIEAFIDSLQFQNITRHRIHALKKTNENYLIQVINGSIFYEDYSTDDLMIFEKARLEAFLEMLHDSLPHLASDKNFDLVLSVKDCCMSRGPVFSVTRCKGTEQIPYVQWNHVRDGPLTKWNQRMRTARKRALKRPWIDKKSAAIFRGSVANKWSFDADGEEAMTRLNASNWRKVGRTILAHLADQHSSLLDVKLRYAREKIPDFPYEEASEEMPMEQQAREFKYTVIVEGNCGWADRFKSFMAMGTVCLVQSTPCQEYYSWMAEPFSEYVPVQGTLGNLTDSIEYLRANDIMAQNISKNAMQFAEKYLSESAMRCYMVRLLQKYQRAYNPHWETS